jgi:hypothetical protein
MAYGRRKAWESNVLALAIVNALTMNGMVAGPNREPQRQSGRRWLPPHALLAEMGVKL